MSGGAAPAPQGRPARRASVPAGVVLAHLATAAVAWLVAGLVAWLALATWTGQQLDEWALQDAAAIMGESAMRWLSLALDPAPVVAIVLGAAAALTVVLRVRRLMAGVAILAMVGLSLASVQALKLVVLSKPDLGIQEAAVNSFPSGHASLAAVAGLAWLLAVPMRMRGWTAAAAACLTIAVGTVTVLTGWHRPADVVAAVLIASGWGALAALVLRATTGPALSRGLAAPGIAKVGLGLSALTAAIALGAIRASAADALAAFIAGLLAIAAATLLAFAGVATISRHR